MSEHTIHTQAIKRLERSRSDKILAGVSSGLGRYFDLTPAVFRLGFIVLTLLGGAGVLVYLTCVLVIPKEGDERSTAEEILANRRDHPARLVALGLIAVAILSLLVRADTLPSAGAAWFLVLVAGVVFLWTSRRRGARRIVVGIVSLATLLLVTAVAALITAFAWFNVSLGDGVGNHTYAPTTIAATTQGYHLGVGKLQVDLTHLPSGRPASVAASVGIGKLRIILPPGVPALVTAHVKAGSVDLLGHHDDGTNVRVVRGSGSTLTIVTNVGAGNVEVLRAP